MIIEQGNLTGLDTTSLNSINDIINYRTFSGLHSDQLSWYSGFVDLQPIINLYLTCNDLCNYNQLTLDGYSGIVKRLSVVAAFTGIIFDNEVSITAYVDCSNKTLQKLNFKIEDERGRQVPLNDVDVSFSLTFFKDQNFLKYINNGQKLRKYSLLYMSNIKVIDVNQKAKQEVVEEPVQIEEATEQVEPANEIVEEVEKMKK